MKKVLISFLMVLILAFSVSAYSSINYTKAGGHDNSYKTGDGIFNLNADPVTSGLKTATRYDIPLVADLDNDSVNEIIVIDGYNIDLYHDHSLDVVDSASHGVLPDYSNMIVFDIDADGYNELILASIGSEAISIMEYNGTNFYQQNSISLAAVTHDDGDMMIGCRHPQECLLVFSRYINPSGVAGEIYAVGFNTTNIGTETKLADATPIGYNFCLPAIKDVVSADYDSHNGGNTTEFIFSAIKAGGGGNQEEIFIWWVNLNGTTLKATEEHETTDTDPSDIINSDNCEDEMGHYVTSPVVFNFDNAASNGLETIVGNIIDTGYFIIKSYGADANEMDDYPETCDITTTTCPTGDVISNIVRADVFIGSEDVDDVCLAGYTTDTQDIDIICGSETQLHSFTKTVELVYDNDANYTLGYNYDDWTPIIHSGHHSGLLTGDDYKDRDEFITHLGVIRISEYDNTPDLDRIYDMPYANCAVIPADPENNSYNDLIALSSTNLYYINDNAENEPGTISSIYFNPCPVDTPVMVNQSMYMLVTVEDNNNPPMAQDQVNSDIIAYYNSVNELKYYSENATSGTTFPFNIYLNMTITSSNIRVRGRDTGNPNITDIIDIPLTVADYGVVYGETDCLLNYTAEAEAEDDAFVSSDLDENDNSITSGVRTWAAFFGLTELIIWLIIMIVVALGIWIKKDYGMGIETFGIIGIVEILLIVVGYFLGIIGLGLIFIFIIGAILIIGLWVRNMLTGQKVS